jgi:hypothetical protein
MSADRNKTPPIITAEAVADGEALLKGGGLFALPRNFFDDLTKPPPRNLAWRPGDPLSIN